MRGLDNRWTSKEAPVLPRSLREVWKSEPLPQWITVELKLPSGSSAAELGSPLWTSSGAEVLTDRQRNFILNLVYTRRSEIQSVRVFARPIPYWLKVQDLPFSKRTRNCLTNENLHSENERLSSLTFGELFAIRSMGVVCILELACIIEAALERSAPSVSTVEPLLADDELLEAIAAPWADQVGPADPRFSDLLPPLPQATIFEMMDAFTAGPTFDATIPAQISRALPALRRRLDQIAALPLEGQLSEFLRSLSRLEGERLQTMVDRFGWGGAPPITLEQAGERLNITRERVRQLQERVCNRLRAILFPVFMPALDEALRALVEASPIAIDAANTLLTQKGISGVKFHAESVIGATLACGRRPPIELQTVRKKTIVVAAQIQSADAILRTAYRQAHASGASNVGEVVAEMAANKIAVEEGKPLPPQN